MYAGAYGSTVAIKKYYPPTVKGVHPISAFGVVLP